MSSFSIDNWEEPGRSLKSKIRLVLEHYETIGADPRLREP